MKFVCVKIFFFSFCLTLFFSCASSGSANSARKPSASGTAKTKNNENSSKTSINVPAQNKKSYFASIDDAIVYDLEIGTPETIRRAAGNIRSRDLGGQENAQVLLAVAAAVMQYAWPGERVTWEVTAAGANTPYIGALGSVRQGIYDLSTGNADFFATLLPALVIPQSRSVSGFFASAEKSLLSCLQLRPNSVIALYLLGLLYNKSGNYEAATTYLTRARDGNPENRNILLALASCFEHAGRAEDALFIAEQLLKKNYSDADALKLGARISFAQADIDRAEEFVGRVLQQEPNNREYVLFRIKILMERQDFIRAASLLDVYARQEAVSRDYLLLRARLQHSWSKNTAAAVATIEQALERYGTDAEVLLFAAELASVTGGNIAGLDTEEISKKILEKNPDTAAAREYYVRGLVQNKKWELAYAESSRLHSADPKNKSYSLLHISVCLALKKNDEAWNAASELYAENRNDTEVLSAYVNVLAQTGRNANALSIINENINTGDANFRSFLFYTRSFLRQKQEETLSDLRSSLIANPRNNDALFRLYQIYFEAGEYRRAQYYLRQVVALNPNDSNYLRLNEELNSLVK